MNNYQIIQPLKPSAKDWHKSAMPAVGSYAVERYVHQRSAISVITAVEVASDGHGGPAEPHYHISMCRLDVVGNPQRCDSNDARWVLSQFNAEGFEEDNHVPNGRVRNFWRPVATKEIGRQCPCKAIEPAIVEDQGDYVWRPGPGART